MSDDATLSRNNFEQTVRICHMVEESEKFIFEQRKLLTEASGFTLRRT